MSSAYYCRMPPLPSYLGCWFLCVCDEVQNVVGLLLVKLNKSFLLFFSLILFYGVISKAKKIIVEHF